MQLKSILLLGIALYCFINGLRLMSLAQDGDLGSAIGGYFAYGYWLFSLIAFSAACICDDLYQLRKSHQQQQDQQDEASKRDRLRSLVETKSKPPSSPRV